MSEMHQPLPEQFFMSQFLPMWWYLIKIFTSHRLFSLICVGTLLFSHMSTRVLLCSTLHLSTAGPQGASGRVQEAQVEARRGGSSSHADRGRRGGSGLADSGGTTGRGAPGRGSGPATAQDAAGDSHADTGGTQQTAGVAAAPAQGASTTGTVQLWRGSGAFSHLVV